MRKLFGLILFLLGGYFVLMNMPSFSAIADGELEASRQLGSCIPPFLLALWGVSLLQNKKDSKDSSA